ncbi:MAG: hypothetical protein V1708_04120 [Candidatus Micrarchaeota archaeon]
MGLRHHLHRQVINHRSPVTRNEVAADAVFFVAGALLSTLAAFIFDIHWSFYPGNTIFPPNKHIFTSMDPYYFAILVGGILGIFIAKLVLLGVREDNEEVLEPRG